ncbi:MAG: hypothetical protein RLZZ246_1185 [Planctomycetota bacterium]
MSVYTPRTVPLEQLTPGERFELQRRRADMTQAEFAALLGVALNRVRRWEAGLSRRGLPDVHVGQLKAWEWCWLQRRRSGRTLADLSQVLGLSIQWIHRAERGELIPAESSVLVDYWLAQRELEAARS